MYKKPQTCINEWVTNNHKIIISKERSSNNVGLKNILKEKINKYIF